MVQLELLKWRTPEKRTGSRTQPRTTWLMARNDFGCVRTRTARCTSRLTYSPVRNVGTHGWRVPSSLGAAPGFGDKPDYECAAEGRRSIVYLSFVPNGYDTVGVCWSGD